jgi:uncharacterized membrane protein
MLQKTKSSEIFKITIGIILLSLSIYFISYNAHFFKATREATGKYFDIKWILLLHISGGAIALLTGPFQFWERLRNKHWRLHRNLGKLYLIAVLVSSVCAVYLSFTTAYTINWMYAFSAQVWVSVWITATLVAYVVVRKKKFKLHKEWMVRSYLVTWAFVFSALILKLPFIQAFGSFADISPSIFWFGWAVPLYIYDLYLTYKRKQ